MLSKMLDEFPDFTKCLTHDHLPTELEQHNKALIKGFENLNSIEDMIDFSSIVNERALLVEKLLNKMQQQLVDNSNKSSEVNPSDIDFKCFAKAEYDINCQLQSIMERLKKDAKDDILSLGKTRKAISKYTGHNVKLHKRAPSSG